MSHRRESPPRVPERPVIIQRIFGNDCSPLLQADSESSYYVTNYRDSYLINQLIASYIEEDLMMDCKMLTVVEPCAGIGGDTIHLAKNFKKVISTEIDKTRFEMCVNNLKVSNCFENVDIKNEDFRNIEHSIGTLNGKGVIYVDPPWGGCSYKDSETCNFGFNNESLVDFVKRMFSNLKPSLIALKLPLNFEMSQFKVLNDKYLVQTHNFKKIMIVILVPKCTAFSML